MRKHNMTLPKRILAMSLSLAMCLGMVCTTAFAQGENPEDYVYVYINVEKDEVQTSAPEKPAGLDEERASIGEAESQVKEAEGAVNDAAQNVGKIPTFTAPTDETNPEGQTNLDVAKGAVEEALKELTEVNKPEYKEATDTPDPDAQPGEGQTPAPDAQTGEGQTPDPDTPDESKDKSFTDTVNETVDGLNGVIEGTEQAVQDGKNEADTAAKVELDDGTNSTLAAEKAKLDAAAKEALDKLTGDRTTAEKAVENANKLTDALPQQQKDLQDELNGKIEALNKPTAPTAPTAPGAIPNVEDYETYEAYERDYRAYETAYAAYETNYATYETQFKEYEDAVNTYNADVAALKAEYDGKLTKLTEDADKAMTDATKALEDAKAALDAFNAIKDKYGPGTDEIPGLDVAANSEAIQKYNDALKAYNDAIAGYTGKADAYNDAAKDYNDAVKEYDDAVGEYNDKVTGINAEDLNGYNNQVGKYNDAVTDYGKKVEAFNGKVGEYNDSVGSYNEGQIAANASSTDEQLNDKLTEALSNLSKEITVGKTVDENGNEVDKKVSGTDTSAWAGLSDEEYNKAVAEYNSRVNAYNLVLTGTAGKKGYNEQLVDDKLAEVDKYFGTSNPHEADGQNWYTVGKISVQGVFGKTTTQILDQNLDKNQYDYNCPDGEKDKTHDDGDKRYIYRGRDVYHFTNMTTNEDGEVIATVENPNTLKNENGLYAEGKSQEDLLNALDSKNLIRYNNQQPNESADFDPTTDIDKWVLKVSYGASDYAGTTAGHEVFHLDGYLRVQQLATLATLEERIVNNYETMDKVEKKDTIGKYDDKGNLTNGLKDADTYDPYQAVMMPNSNPEPEDPDSAWTGGEVKGYTIADLTRPGNEVAGSRTDKVPGDPDGITPPPTPEGGNPGGGGGTGGGGGGGGDTPPVIINDPDVPLAETPEEPVEEPVVEIPDEEVPLAETPEEVVIPDEDVPLAAVPQTGDISTAWYAVALTSACALAAVSLRKKEDED